MQHTISNALDQSRRVVYGHEQYTYSTKEKKITIKGLSDDAATDLIRIE